VHIDTDLQTPNCFDKAWQWNQGKGQYVQPMCFVGVSIHIQVTQAYNKVGWGSQIVKWVFSDSYQHESQTLRENQSGIGGLFASLSVCSSLVLFLYCYQ
jgi:hypothetical protein